MNTQHRDRESAALAILRRGYTDSQRTISSYQILFHILIFPSRVQCAESWTVFRDIDAVTRQQNSYISYLRWRRDAGGETPPEEGPVIEYREVILEERLARRLVRGFERASVQAMTKHRWEDIPIDGTMYEVVLGGIISSRFRWFAGLSYDEPPPGWKALWKATRETVACLREVIGQEGEEVC